MVLAEGFLVGALLGFSLAVPPGPMNAWIAAVAARSYRGGVLTGFGAMTADAVLGTAVFLVEQVADLRGVVRFVYALGAVIMAYLGARLLARPTFAFAEVPDQRTFVRALALGLGNPYQILWWLTAGIAFAYLGGWVLLLGLFGAIGVWILVFPWVVHAGARRSPRVQDAVRIASAGILIVFAGYFGLLALGI